MASILGITGSVESWDDNSALIATGASVIQLDANFSADTVEATPIGAASAPGYLEFVRSIRQWSGTITTRLQPALTGMGRGSVVFAGGYTNRASAWTMNIASSAVPDPAFNLTGNWMEFIPGPVGWSGTYETAVDDTVLLDANANWLGGVPAAATFTYDADSSPDKTLAGNIVITGHATSNVPAQRVNNTISYQGTSTLTGAGGTNPPLTGAVAPVTGELVATFDGTRGFTGDAFWTSIAVSCAYDGLITFTIGFQGTGELDID